MTTLTILAVTVAVLLALAALAKLAVRSDGYRRRTRPPASKLPDAFAPPAWHSPWP